MRASIQLAAVVMVCAAAAVAVGHHSAPGIVDEDIHAMIEDLVADTPHGDAVTIPLVRGMTEIVITQVTIREVENMIAEGLLTYGGMLDGQVTAQIGFATMRDVEIVIHQEE